MVHALQSSLTFYLTAFFVSFSFLPTVICTDADLPAGDTRVDLTDAVIQYDPPMNDTEVWTPSNFSRINVISTSNKEATISLTFRGTRVSLLAFAYSKFPDLLVTLDSSKFGLPDFRVDHKKGGSGKGGMDEGDSDKEDWGRKVVTLPLGGTNLDGSVSHNLTIQKAQGTDDDDSWNLMALSFKSPPSSSPHSVKSMLSSTTVSLPSLSASEPVGSKSSGKLSGGATAGVVIGVLLSVGVSGFILIFVCRRRRRREMMDVSPDPLMITTGMTPRPNRSRFRRLPHFTAPSSIWPPTETPVSTTLVPPPLPIARESLHERITPFELPTLAPQIRISAPPKQRKTRRPRYSSFFIANPSNHSSNSARSHPPLSDQRVRPDHIPAKGSKVDLLEIDVEEKEMEDHLKVMRVDKGKQKAVNFGTGSRSPPRQRMSRKQSIRRFFTTNPSPSTASSSSTSSKKTANSKRAAVTDYVRNQMRQKPPAGSHLDSIPLPPPVPALRPLPPIVIPEKVKSGLRQAPMQQILPSQPPPAGKRQSQTLLFAANPDPSTHNPPSDHASTSSSISEIPPPRKDKGKARAF